jgi:glycosyltransferase involved in cell wall biosynthesis/GT2 family glycosyltransferase
MPPLVSVVIPCYNPTRYLEETLAGVRAQTYRPLEVILVNDGTDRPESLELLRRVATQADRVLEQENLGLAAARNTGFRAAQGDYVLPLDADDRLRPSSVAQYVAGLEAHPDAAFVYPDYRVFGDRTYTEHTPEYNLYRLLRQNTLIYAALIRRADWEAAGGYDERMRLGYEDWEFWLRLGERGRYGRHVGKVLFEYRKHGRSLLTLAQEHHEQIVAYIRERHPGLYSWEGQVRVKREWAPAVCLLGPEPAAPQTIADWSRGPVAESRATAFWKPSASPDAHAAEWCALAVWGGKAPLRLSDGSQALPHPAAAAPAPSNTHPPTPLTQLRRHLVNAELDWRHPVRSALRLIPLRVKERVNRWAGRPVFDLSFYLRFQPQSVLTAGSLVEPLRYLPPPAAGRRLALITPHLGPGGAESVLLEVAAAIDRSRAEVFLIATQSRDGAWRRRWEQAADHVYDLASLVAPERLVAALYSLALNWAFDAVILQNSLPAYSAIPHWKRGLPGLRIVDLIHAVHEEWDFVSSTAAVAAGIDARVAVSQAAAARLRAAGTPATKIRLIRNGVDLDRFRPAPAASNHILFAGRLDPIKRPLLLPAIASELARIRPRRDFRFVVAGEGPEGPALRRSISRAGLDQLFDLCGHVDDMPGALAAAAILLIPSKAEGIPLAALEAFAMERPVVASKAGATGEVVRPDTGILVDPGPGEAARLAAALHDLLEHAGRRRDLGRAGRRLVESEYSRDQAQQAYRALLQEALGL